jgi:hypothetical protein
MTTESDVETGVLGTDEERRREAADALIRRLDAMPSWSCRRCSAKMRGFKPMSKLCENCEARTAHETERQRPPDEVWARARVPHILRGDPPWKEGEWPRDPRSSASAMHPDDDWPAVAAGLSADLGAQGPRSLTLRGSNDVGKSRRAAWLLLRLHREGLFGGRWIREGDLLAEDARLAPWEIRPLRHAARSAQVLVLDDLFAARGGPARVEESLGTILDLIDARVGNTTQITIYTTHRHLSRRGAKSAGGVEGESVEAIAPAVYGRLLEGLVLDCGSGPGYRGAWTNNRTGGQLK